MSLSWTYIPCMKSYAICNCFCKFSGKMNIQIPCSSFTMTTLLFGGWRNKASKNRINRWEAIFGVKKTYIFILVQCLGTPYLSCAGHNKVLVVHHQRIYVSNNNVIGLCHFWWCSFWLSIRSKFVQYQQLVYCM